MQARTAVAVEVPHAARSRSMPKLRAARAVVVDVEMPPVGAKRECREAPAAGDPQAGLRAATGLAIMQHGSFRGQGAVVVAGFAFNVGLFLGEAGWTIGDASVAGFCTGPKQRLWRFGRWRGDG
jgi:hypothetical protein